MAKKAKRKKKVIAPKTARKATATQKRAAKGSQKRAAKASKSTLTLKKAVRKAPVVATVTATMLCAGVAEQVTDLKAKGYGLDEIGRRVCGAPASPADPDYANYVQCLGCVLAAYLRTDRLARSAKAVSARGMVSALVATRGESPDAKARRICGPPLQQGDPGFAAYVQCLARLMMSGDVR